MPIIQSYGETYYGERVKSNDRVTKKLRASTDSALSSSLRSTPVAVLVGPQEEEVFVHEALLKSSSSFLKNALKSEWKDPNKRQIKLHGVDIDSFRIYINWLYTGHFNIVDINADRPKPTPENPEVLDHEWTKWRCCYELANSLQDNDCKDALIDMLIEKMMTDEAYSDELPDLIYELTPNCGASPARKPAVDIAVNVWSEKAIQEVHDAKYPTEFLTDVVVEMGGKLRGCRISETSVQSFFKNADTCKYHEHSVIKAPCYKTKREI